MVNKRARIYEPIQYSFFVFFFFEPETVFVITGFRKYNVSDGEMQSSLLQFSWNFRNIDVKTRFIKVSSHVVHMIWGEW